MRAAALESGRGAPLRHGHRRPRGEGENQRPDGFPLHLELACSLVQNAKNNGVVGTFLPPTSAFSRSPRLHDCVCGSPQWPVPRVRPEPDAAEARDEDHTPGGQRRWDDGIGDVGGMLEHTRRSAARLRSLRHDLSTTSPRATVDPVLEPSRRALRRRTHSGAAKVGGGRWPCSEPAARASLARPACPHAAGRPRRAWRCRAQAAAPG